MRNEPVDKIQNKKYLTFDSLQISENPIEEDIVFWLICTYLNFEMQIDYIKRRQHTF